MPEIFSTIVVIDLYVYMYINLLHLIPFDFLGVWAGMAWFQRPEPFAGQMIFDTPCSRHSTSASTRPFFKSLLLRTQLHAQLRQQHLELHEVFFLPKEGVPAVRWHAPGRDFPETLLPT